MRKKQIFLLLSAILILTAIMTACSAEIYNVDFYVDGVLYKSYKVEVNQSLDDVPEVPLKDGYIGKWDVVDFDEITKKLADMGYERKLCQNERQGNRLFP